jgi:hypothetical protein
MCSKDRFWTDGHYPNTNPTSGKPHHNCTRLVVARNLEKDVTGAGSQDWLVLYTYLSQIVFGVGVRLLACSLWTPLISESRILHGRLKVWRLTCGHIAWTLDGQVDRWVVPFGRIAVPVCSMRRLANFVEKWVQPEKAYHAAKIPRYA